MPPHNSGMEAIMSRLGRLNSFAVRFASTSSASAPPFRPSNIFVKVGDSGKYLDWVVQWDDLKLLRVGGLLGELAKGMMFSSDLMGVKFSQCDVGVVSGPTMPDMLTEASKVTSVSYLTTVLEAATARECTGENIFIHVRLPGAVPNGKRFASEEAT